VIGVKDIVDFTPKEDVWDRFAQRLGAGAAEVLGGWAGLDSRLRLE
jgi:protease-4